MAHNDEVYDNSQIKDTSAKLACAAFLQRCAG